MPKSLEKTRKQIAKKKNGTIDALHQFSRNSKRLHKAQVRDDRLEKLAAARKKHDQPLIHRVNFFREAAQENDSQALDMDKIQTIISRYVHQYDDEYESVRKTRRPGRPASAREDLLKMKIDALEREYQNGFFVPDLSKQENLALLDRWEGSWAFLPSLSWVRISKTGAVRPSTFPPSSQ